VTGLTRGGSEMGFGRRWKYFVIFFCFDKLMTGACGENGSRRGVTVEESAWFC
jgi:hypothetical protein